MRIPCVRNDLHQKDSGVPLKEKKKCWAKSWPIGRKHVEMRFEHISSRCCHWDSGQSPRLSAFSARFDSATLRRICINLSFLSLSLPLLENAWQMLGIGLDQCNHAMFNEHFNWLMPPCPWKRRLYVWKINQTQCCRNRISFVPYATTTTKVTIFNSSLA